MENPQTRPARLASEYPQLKAVGSMLRDWLEGGRLAALPLGELVVSWERHRAQVEEPGGLFDTLLARAPRVAGDIEELRSQHCAMDADIRRLLRLEDPSEHAALIAHLADQIEAHCDRAVELVYEAFDQEFGGG